MTWGAIVLIYIHRCVTIQTTIRTHFCSSWIKLRQWLAWSETPSVLVVLCPYNPSTPVNVVCHITTVSSSNWSIRKWSASTKFRKIISDCRSLENLIICVPYYVWFSHWPLPRFPIYICWAVTFQSNWKNRLQFYERTIRKW